MYNFQPLEQFEIIFLGYLFNLPFIGNIPINNSILYMFIMYLLIRFFFSLIFLNFKIIPSNWQSFFELFYKFAFSLVKQQIGVKGYSYFPIVMTLFLFILFSNLLGMTLYSFTITSHAIITFSLGFAFFIGIIIIGITEQKIKFLNTFIPSGAPGYLLPFLVIIEIISYFSRPISLSIRLFANMMSGHALLAILSGFTLAISQKNILIAFIPFALIILIVGLEAMIAILQAYVFTVLICIYISDSVHGAH